MGALVVLAMVATAVTAFFYLRIVVVMYFAEPVSNRLGRRRHADSGRCECYVGAGRRVGPGRRLGGAGCGPLPSGRPSPMPRTWWCPGLLTVIVIAVAVIVTLGLGLFPGPVLDWLTVPLPMLS